MVKGSALSSDTRSPPPQHDAFHPPASHRTSLSLLSTSSHLALETLDQVADGHAGGDGVRVDDDVGRDTLGREWHVLLPELDPARA